MCYTSVMDSADNKITFLWGTPEEVAARDHTGLPTFRLCREGGAFPPVAQTFDFMPGEGTHLLMRGDRPVAATWSDADADYCLMAGVTPPNISAPRGEQASETFLEIERVLAKAGMTFANVVRTWLYIDDVCDWYGEFNAARTAFFNTRNVFETFLPASTGIGCANLDGAAVMAGAFAMKSRRDGVRAEIVESPLQAPAMAYKSSFSRAAEWITPARRRLFISGTASIQPNSHEVAFVGDIERQIDCTMKAVLAILESRGYGWQDTVRSIVYLKKPEFLPAWRAWLAEHRLPTTFAAETVCDVCRDEWLFEIELDAVRNM